MDTLIGALVIVLIIWLLVSGLSTQKLFRCQKCGFTTASELEAVGHEKLENAHKVVKE